MVRWRHINICLVLQIAYFFLPIFASLFVSLFHFSITVNHLVNQLIFLVFNGCCFIFKLLLFTSFVLFHFLNAVKRLFYRLIQKNKVWGRDWHHQPSDIIHNKLDKRILHNVLLKPTTFVWTSFVSVQCWTLKLEY